MPQLHTEMAWNIGLINRLEFNMYELGNVGVGWLDDDDAKLLVYKSAVVLFEVVFAVCMCYIPGMLRGECTYK